jgi:hypothetical protein
MGQRYEFFSACPDGTLHRPVSKPALLTLPMTLFSGTASACQKKTSTIELSGPVYRTTTYYLTCPLIPDGHSFKIRRPPFGPLALLTFRNILDLSAFKNRFHFDFSTAGTKEFLGCAGRPGIFTGLSHNQLSLPYHILWRLFYAAFNYPAKFYTNRIL